MMNSNKDSQLNTSTQENNDNLSNQNFQSIQQQSQIPIGQRELGSNANSVSFTSSTVGNNIQNAFRNSRSSSSASQYKPPNLSATNLMQNVNAFGNSIHSTFQNYLHPTDRKQEPIKRESSFRKKDILICIVCFIGLLFALFSGSNIKLVPLMHMENLRTSFKNEFITGTNYETNFVHEPTLNSNLLNQLKTGNPLLHTSTQLQDAALDKDEDFQNQKKLNDKLANQRRKTQISSSLKYLCFYDADGFIIMKKDTISAWKNYKSHFTNSDSFNEGFFKWIQSRYPQGYVVYHAETESSGVSKIQGSKRKTYPIVSISLADNHLLVFFDNWSLEMYNIHESEDAIRLSLLWSNTLLNTLINLDSNTNSNQSDELNFKKKQILEFIIGKPKEVVVTFLNDHKIHEEDSGLVVIGMRSKFAIRTLNDFEASRRRNEIENNIIVTLKESEEYENENTINAHPLDIHYSYIGIEAHSGNVRWKHDNDDFQYTHKENTYPQHNFKVDMDLHLTHSGEVHWRNYFDDIMSKAIPHIYRHEKDIKITPFHFKPTEKRRSFKNQKSNQNTVKQFGEIGDRFQSVLSSYKDANKEKKAKKVEFPNVLVVHMSQGIEIIHIYTGRTLCQVTPLKKNVAYGNLNQDGSINAAQSIIKPRDVLKGDSNECKAEIESGSKGNSEIVFQASVCSIQSGWKKFGLSRFLKRQESASDESSSPIVVTPAILQRYDGMSFKITHDIVYLSSTGLATCLTKESSGKWKVKWQVETMSDWSRNDVDENSYESFFPHISAFRLRENDRDQTAILVGRKFLTLLDIHGNIQQVLPLPSSPVIAPVQFIDVDQDGFLDVQIETKDGIYIYSSKRRAGTSVLSFILIALAMILSAMYLSTNVNLDDPSYVKSKEFSE